MRHFKVTSIIVIALILSSAVYIVSCTHDDNLIVPSGTAAIKRGTDIIRTTDGWNFDKVHSNVQWETAYLGSGALLTGRFNMFGMTSFSFDETNPSNTSFEAWVRLNTVNTSEPGRDGGCLLGTFGTAAGLVDQPENLAIIRSKSVALNTSDKGYTVTCDLTFHGVTKQVIAKLIYTGKTDFAAGVAGPNPLSLAGFSIEFQFLCKTDFGIVSNSVADKVGIRCNAELKKS